MFKYQVDDDTYLSLLEMRHAEEHYNAIANNREHIATFLSFATDHTLEDTRSFIQSSLNKFAAGTDIPCIIWYQDRLVGSIGLHLSPNRKAASIGYWLAQDCQGNGIMTKCCRAIIDYAFNELQLHRIEIRAITTNTKSRAIPERLGFKQEGILRQDVMNHGEFVDTVVYGMLAEEWLK